MLKHKDKLLIPLLLVLFFALFFLISYWTPLAGDDWGYALNGLKGNPIELALQFYFTWSGRFFSELWGFVVAPNKWLWNILNPLLFTGIAFLMFCLVNPKKKKLSILLLIFFLILSVKDYVRMETYTWIMGTTYVVPLFLFLLYLYFAKLMILDYNKNKVVFGSSLILNFIIPLWMENIATTLIFANILFIIHLFFHDRTQVKKFIWLLLLSSLSFLILRLSPGASYRLINDHSAWLNLSLFEQIQHNWNNFLTYTFLDNKYLILTFSLTLLGTLYSHRFNYKGKSWIFTPLALIFSLGALQSMSSFIYGQTGWSFLLIFFDLSSSGSVTLLSVFYTLYALATFFVLVTFLLDTLQWTSVFFTLIAGSSTLVMLFSPIFGARSSLYFIFLIILLIASLYNSLDIHPTLNSCIAILLFSLCLIWAKNYYTKYTLVHQAQIERLDRIEWIKENPQLDEAWIERFPIMSVHSADIEDDDTYHQDVFKQYYNLDEDLKLIFYWPE
ncbi:MAG: DUF6056 family protein [Anaerorhabdus sp.]